MDNISYVIHSPLISRVSLSRGFRRVCRPTCSAASILSLLAKRGMGTLYLSLLGLWGIVPVGAVYLSHRPAFH